MKTKVTLTQLEVHSFLPLGKGRRQQLAGGGGFDPYSTSGGTGGNDPNGD